MRIAATMPRCSPLQGFGRGGGGGARRGTRFLHAIVVEPLTTRSLYDGATGGENRIYPDVVQPIIVTIQWGFHSVQWLPSRLRPHCSGTPKFTIFSEVLHYTESKTLHSALSHYLEGCLKACIIETGQSEGEDFVNKQCIFQR